MSASNALENEILEHILNNADIALVGDAVGLRGSSVDGDLFIALHTADPGEAGNQTTNETAYGSYVRKAVSRDGTQWTVTGDTAANAALLEFVACTSGTSTITHFSIGTASSGTGKVLFIGLCSLVVSTGITPRFVAGALTVTAA